MLILAILYCSCCCCFTVDVIYYCYFLSIVFLLKVFCCCNYLSYVYSFFIYNIIIIVDMCDGSEICNRQLTIGPLVVRDLVIVIITIIFNVIIIVFLNAFFQSKFYLLNCNNNNRLGDAPPFQLTYISSLLTETSYYYCC